ncbi:hypothetical protein ACE6H2_007081 [Prunus campanulata]
MRIPFNLDMKLWLIINWNYKMLRKNSEVHNKGKNPKTTKDESKTENKGR